MKVDIVNSNYQSAAFTPKLKAGKVKKIPNFTGMSQVEKDMMNLLYHKRAIEFMKSFEWLKGEIGGILLTAVGTGLVAPIFIGFNPFVSAPKDATPEQKEDVENTKQYTAMRQPISAALAILFQAGVQKYIDKGLDAIFNNPERSKKVFINVDRQILNTDTYIKDKVKKKLLEEENLQKPSYIKSLFNPELKKKRKEYNIKFEQEVDAMKEAQLQTVVDSLKKDHIIHIGTRDLDHETTARLINKQIESYRKDANELIKKDQQKDFYTKRAGILHKNQEHIKEIFKEIPYMESKAALKDYLLAMRDISADEAKRAACKEKLNQINKTVSDAVQILLDKEPKDSEVRTLLEEIMSKPEDMRAHRVERTLKRIESINEVCNKFGGKFIPEEYMNILLSRNSELEKRRTALYAAEIKDVKNADAKVIEEAINKIREACHFDQKDTVLKNLLENTDTFDSNPEKLTDKIYKDIAKAYKKMVENHYKGWNQLTKVGVGVFITLPITCTALNWVYPRFMEIFFPKLAGVKKDKAPEQVNAQGGDK